MGAQAPGQVGVLVVEEELAIEATNVGQCRIPEQGGASAEAEDIGVTRLLAVRAEPVPVSAGSASGHDVARRVHHPDGVGGVGSDWHEPAVLAAEGAAGRGGLIEAALQPVCARQQDLGCDGPDPLVAG